MELSKQLYTDVFPNYFSDQQNQEFEETKCSTIYHKSISAIRYVKRFLSSHCKFADVNPHSQGET